MPWTFNPFTGSFDQKGSGGGGGASYIDGEVATYTDLPLDGSAALNTAWLVREASGTWLLARKPAGIYIRTANTGVRADDWTYAGEFPDVFNDANLVVYANADSTKNVKFDVSAVTTGTTRTITVPDRNVALPDQDTGTTDAVEFTQVEIYKTEGSGQDSAFKSLSTENTDPSDFSWRGRALIGAENLTFLMGAYNGKAGLGAHSWESAEEETDPAWADFLLNPDGGESVFIGCQNWDKDTAIVKISNTTGTLELAASDDQTKKVTFDVTGVEEGETRTLEIPDASGTIALNPMTTAGDLFVGGTSGAPARLALGTASQQLRVNSGATSLEYFTPAAAFDPASPPAIGNTTAAAANFTTVGATGIITGANTTASPPTTLTEARGLQFASLGGNFGSTAAVYGSHPSTASLGIGIANSSAGSITQVASFTSTGLSITGGTLTASAPVLDLAQTWNASGVTFTGLRFNATDTASAAASNLAEFQVGGTALAAIRKDGSFRVLGSGDRTLLAHPNFALSATAGGAWLGVNTTVSINGSLRSVGGTILIGTAQGTDFATLDRDAAHTFAQRSGTNAQEYRVYGTYTTLTNYQRLTIKTKAVTLSALTGASVATTGGFIPDGAVLVGLTTRVSTAITGATGYDIGDGSDADRWGANVAIALNTSSDNRDWTAGTVECFTAAQEVTLTAVGGNFTNGAVVIVAHYLAGEAD